MHYLLNLNYWAGKSYLKKLFEEKKEVTSTCNDKSADSIFVQSIMITQHGCQ